MATPRSLPLFLLLLATASLLAFASLSTSAAKDDDLDYIIDNAGDLEANDPEGWLQEGSPSSDEEDSDLFGEFPATPESPAQMTGVSGPSDFRCRVCLLWCGTA